MPINFSCPHCGKQTTVADQYAGQSGPCSGCGQTVTIPYGGMGTPAAKPISKKSGSGAGAGILIGLAVAGVVLLMCGGVLVALLLPAVQAAREAARRSACSNNLKQIGLALHNYHDTYKTFPPAYLTDENGTPTVSWRVLILPFLEQQAVHSMVDTSKPWDAPENAFLKDLVIPAYGCPSSPSGGTPETSYMFVVGPNAFATGADGTRIASITDGTSNTIMVVEVAGTGVHWAQPKDLDMTQMSMAVGQSSNEIDSFHPGGAQVLMADGSVRFIADTIDPNVLQSPLTRSGGEQVMGF
ncbi:MAG: DUF1559 domain-containing protein [Planctomycetales bacterium]|nr:DUF1559 domain-containing protein [Planctomycetales bacterium]